MNNIDLLLEVIYYFVITLWCRQDELGDGDCYSFESRSFNGADFFD